MAATRSKQLNERRPRAWAVSLCALAVSGAAASAQLVDLRPAEPPAQRARPAARTIALCGASIDTMGPCPALHEAIVSDRRKGRTARRLMQLDGPLTPARRDAMHDAGLEIEQCVGGDAFLVRTGDADAQCAAALDFIRWHGALQPGWKIDPRLGQRELETEERQAIADAGRLVVDVSFGKGVDVEAARAAMASIENARVSAAERIGENAVVSIIVAPAQIDLIAARNDVLAIQEHPEPTLRASSTRSLVQSRFFGATPLYDQGLTGAGQILGVVDSRIDAGHCSFFDETPFGSSHRKIVAYNAPPGQSDHGTHVAAIAVGDAGSFDDRRGVAFDARLVFSDIPSVLVEGPLLTIFTTHHNQGARVHTNSWGVDNDDSYNAWARAVDVFSWENEEDLVIFAVSNRQVLGSPENAKNCLAVAASRDLPQEELHGSGGAGPTIDGRRKPELFAPGVGIISADAQTGCNVIAQTGTSMAAPAVAGVAALVRQYFEDGFHPSGAPIPEDALTPTGALLRAVLLNAGKDMDGIAGFPSNVEGWGRLVVDDALFFEGDERRTEIVDIRRADPDALQTGDMRTRTFAVESSAAELRVTLVYTDAPAAPGAGFTPVNDLDLEVLAPNGDVYRGNVFAMGESAPNALFDSGGGFLFDPLNNVEQVRIKTPIPGEWTVRIHGAAVNVGPSGYALVASADLQEPPAPCPSDLDGDGATGSADLALLLANWGQGPGAADLSGDGDVGSADLSLLLGLWGPCAE